MVENSEMDEKLTEEQVFAELFDIYFPNSTSNQHPPHPPPSPIEVAPPPIEVVPPPLEVASPLPEERYMMTTMHIMEAEEQLVLSRQIHLQNHQHLQHLQHLQQVHQELVREQHPMMQTVPRSVKIGVPQTRKMPSKMKTVYMVPAANIHAMDQWAWRKYGQKPIKGGTFPRSYYKCSSSKECNARKQVEMCKLEPEIYLVTYIGNHIHPNPVQPAQNPGSVPASLIPPVPPQPNPQPEMLSSEPLAMVPEEIPLMPPEISTISEIMSAPVENEVEELPIPNMSKFLDEDTWGAMEELEMWKNWSSNYQNWNNPNVGDGSGDGSGSSGSAGMGF